MLIGEGVKTIHVIFEAKNKNEVQLTNINYFETTKSILAVSNKNNLTSTPSRQALPGLWSWLLIRSAYRVTAITEKE